MVLKFKLNFYSVKWAVESAETIFESVRTEPRSWKDQRSPTSKKSSKINNSQKSNKTVKRVYSKKVSDKIFDDFFKRVKSKSSKGELEKEDNNGNN